MVRRSRGRNHGAPGSGKHFRNDNGGWFRGGWFRGAGSGEAVSGPSEAAVFLGKGRKEEASKVLDEYIVARLGDFGMVLKKEKELSAMEKMRLMMQKKREQQ